MNEEDFDRAYDIYDILYSLINELVDRELKDTTPEVEDFVRTKLAEEFHFG